MAETIVHGQKIGPSGAIATETVVQGNPIREENLQRLKPAQSQSNSALLQTLQNTTKERDSLARELLDCQGENASLKNLLKEALEQNDKLTAQLKNHGVG